jgi:hypothetical protein
MLSKITDVFAPLLAIIRLGLGNNILYGGEVHSSQQLRSTKGNKTKAHALPQQKKAGKVRALSTEGFFP